MVLPQGPGVSNSLKPRGGDTHLGVTGVLAEGGVWQAGCAADLPHKGRRRKWPFWVRRRRFFCEIRSKMNVSL